MNKEEALKIIKIAPADIILEVIEVLKTRNSILEEKLHEKDKYIDGLHQDLQEAIQEIDKLRGDTK